MRKNLIFVWLSRRTIMLPISLFCTFFYLFISCMFFTDARCPLSISWFVCSRTFVCVHQVHNKWVTITKSLFKIRSVKYYEIKKITEKNKAEIKNTQKMGTNGLGRTGNALGRIHDPQHEGTLKAPYLQRACWRSSRKVGECGRESSVGVVLQEQAKWGFMWSRCPVHVFWLPLL